MKKIGDIIPAHFRNCGASLGLQYPYIYAHDLRQWIIWHRETGEVVHVEPDDQHPCVAESNCSQKCHAINGVNPWPDAETLAAIDATP